jgi:hypothetical protein
METRSEIVMRIDTTTGELITVTDKEGRPAERFEPTPKNPLPPGAVLSATSRGMSFLTQITPCYRYVL